MKPPSIERLSHFVALRKDGTTEDVAAQLVCGALAALPSHSASAADVHRHITEDHRFPLALPVVERALDELLNSGKIGRQTDGTFLLTETDRKAVEARAEQWADLESSVRLEWRVKAEDAIGQLDDAAFDELWEFLTEFLANGYARHGIGALALIDPSAHVPGTVLSPESLIQSAGHDRLDKYGEEVVRALIGTFFSGDSPARDSYLAWNLTTTFSYYSLFVDEATVEYLSAGLSELRVFVDTNFLFGILELHDGPWNSVSKYLLQLCKENNLPIHFYIHEETLKELNEWLDGQSSYLRGAKYPPAISRAALASEMPLFLRRYHEENARAPIDADAYLMQFNNLQRSLEREGFRLFREPDRDRDPLEYRGKLEAEYEHFLSGRRVQKERSPEAIRHDMIVVSTAKRGTRPSPNPLNTGAYLLTIDGQLYAFVRDNLTDSGRRPVTIFPGQLLQLILPLVNQTSGFEKSLAAAFQLPIFRAVQIDRGRAQARILSVSRGIQGMTEDQAREVLTDELLIANVSHSPSEEAVVEAVESAVAMQYSELQQKVDLLTERLAAEEAAKDKRGEMQSVLSEKLETKSADHLAAVEELQNTNARLETLEKQMSKMLPPRSSFYFAGVGALALVALYSVVRLWSVQAIEWPWLYNHSNRDSLRLLATAVILAAPVAAGFLYKKQVAGWIFTAIVAGGLLTLLSLVGRF